MIACGNNRLTKRNLMLFVLTSLIVGAHSTHATGLGDMVLCPSDHIAVVAQIPISDIPAGDSSGVTARIASEADFALVGMQHAAEVQALSIATDFSSAQAPGIRVSGCLSPNSNKLSFLLDFRWPAGRLLRQYVIDPQGGAPAIPVSLRIHGDDDSPREGSAGMSTHRRYQVEPGDTLWRIASGLSGERSVYELMTVIYGLNQDAFINHDPNLLRADVLLLLP